MPARLADGHVDEIRVRGPNVGVGYYGRLGPFLCTGDLCARPRSRRAIATVVRARKNSAIESRAPTLPLREERGAVSRPEWTGPRRDPGSRHEDQDQDQVGRQRLVGGLTARDEHVPSFTETSNQESTTMKTRTKIKAGGTINAI